jgi:hypothetical protein
MYIKFQDWFVRGEIQVKGKKKEIKGKRRGKRASVLHYNLGLS